MQLEREPGLPTTAAEWRKLRQAGDLVELPSGHVARLRPVSLLELARLGRLDGPLTALAAELLTGGVQAQTIKEVSLAPVVELLGLVCRAAFLEPRIAPEGSPPGPGEIDIDDVSQEDQEFVLAYVQRPGGALTEFFRTRRAERAAAAGGIEPGLPSAAQ